MAALRAVARRSMAALIAAAFSCFSLTMRRRVDGESAMPSFCGPCTQHRGGSASLRFTASTRPLPPISWVSRSRARSHSADSGAARSAGRCSAPGRCSATHAPRVHVLDYLMTIPDTSQYLPANTSKAFEVHKAVPHAHSSAISLKLIDALTNQTLCEVSRANGKLEYVGAQLVFIDSCAWGPDDAPRLALDHPLRGIQVYEATEHLTGLMSAWRLAAVPV